MVSYYTLLLLVTLLLQTKKDMVWRNIITLILVSSSNVIVEGYLSYGYSVYESAVRCEIIYLILLVFTLGFHKSKLLFVVTITSLLVNALYTATDSMGIKLLIYNNYELFNLILFECLLYHCTTSTRIFLWVKRYLNTIKDKSLVQKKVKLC